ncbi:Uncharacterised protein [uncultured Flavonifractor sp.]|nr:Uncharacterised protein [uncultured Flavonifractor sp.]
MPSAAFFSSMPSGSAWDRRYIPQTTAFLLYMGIGYSMGTSVLISMVKVLLSSVSWTFWVLPSSLGSQPHSSAACSTFRQNSSTAAFSALEVSNTKIAREAIWLALPYTMSFRVGSPSRRVTPAPVLTKAKGLPRSPERFIVSVGVHAFVLPTTTGNRESEV